jgi:hypothetical protein
MIGFLRTTDLQRRETVDLSEILSSDEVTEEEKERVLVGTASVAFPVELEVEAGGTLRTPIADTDAIVAMKVLSMQHSTPPTPFHFFCGG